MDLKKLTAPCGLGCFACAVYTENITDELKANLSEEMGVSKEEIPCDGCWSEKGCCFESILTNGKGCPTKNCVVEKQLHNCSECDEFPCKHLMPSSDFAEKVPHNIKVFSLATIKRDGLEEWAKTYPDHLKRYFGGKFTYGTCPKFESEE